jgi:nanoRNase/pAp phosphatase (c-di-AMP/oligoRNAs hydrolase)
MSDPVAYRIHLPSQLAAIHDVFHISQLQKCIKVPTEIIETPTIEIEPDLTYTEQPIQILDTKERITKRKKIKMYKILWDHHTEEEATWETEFYLQRNFPNFLQTNSQI